MEILITLNKSMWRITWNSIKKVETMDYGKYGSTFDRLWRIQHETVLKGEEKVFKAFSASSWNDLDDNTLPLSTDPRDQVWPRKKAGDK